MQSEPGIQTLRATTHPLFDLAPGGACHDGRDHSRSRQALTLPFHPYPVKPGGLLSVALSFLQICFAEHAADRNCGGICRCWSGDPFQPSYEGYLSGLIFFNYIKSEEEIAELYQSFCNEPGFAGKKEEFWLDGDL